MQNLANISIVRSGLDGTRGRNGRPQSKRRLALPTIDLLESRTLFSTVTVTNLNDSGTGSLRNAIATASAGDIVKFAPSLKGTITLTSGELPITKNLTINGPGANRLTVSGNGHSRAFDITKAGATVKISGLSIVHGSAQDGAGIDNAGGNLSVSYCNFNNNIAIGASGDEGRGGAIFNGNGSNLNVAASGFYSNVAVGSYGNNGGGGAIYNFTGSAESTTHVNGSTFLNNRATGGGNGGFGLGGAIINFINGSATASALTVSWSTFVNNVAQGGIGGGFGVGGGVWSNSDFSSAAIDHSTFTGNRASGGAGGGFGIGGGVANGFGASLNISTSLLTGNLAVGGAGGGSAIGGGFANFDIGPDPQSTASVIDSTLILNNRATGGAGGGAAQGGGIYNGLLPLGPLPSPLAVIQLSVTDSSIVANQATGGSGGGDGQGGGVFAELGSQSSLAESIVTGNSASAGSGTGGTGIGGGLYVHAAPNAAVFHLVGSIVTENSASTSNSNVFGITTA